MRQVVAGVTLEYRVLSTTAVVNASDLVVAIDAGVVLSLSIEIRNDTWRVSSTGGGPLRMEETTKEALVGGLRSDKDECSAWNALVAQQADALIGGVSVVSEHLIKLTLPPLPGYDVRVLESISLIVPGVALTSAEDIPSVQLDLPVNAFVLRPDTSSGQSLETCALPAAPPRAHKPWPPRHLATSPPHPTTTSPPRHLAPRAGTRCTTARRVQARSSTTKSSGTPSTRVRWRRGLCCASTSNSMSSRASTVL